MNQLHPYSTAIYMNKRGRAKGVYDDSFAILYSSVIRALQHQEGVDGICAIPPKRGEKSRFEDILHYVTAPQKV